jgi:hypothetical protein
MHNPIAQDEPTVPWRRLPHQPTPSQTGGRKLWLDENGGRIEAQSLAWATNSKWIAKSKSREDLNGIVSGAQYETTSGIPNGLHPPLAFGIYTRRHGMGRYPSRRSRADKSPIHSPAIVPQSDQKPGSGPKTKRDFESS